NVKTPKTRIPGSHGERTLMFVMGSIYSFVRVRGMLPYAAPLVLPTGTPPEPNMVQGRQALAGEKGKGRANCQPKAYSERVSKIMG
ncbi:MAG TPA: hypothetical protein VEM15_10515, partial [Thermodesulfobacteriota bacterium]|nr:hypothetical protein [Thermodesulfobacteriota bacterium]